VKLPRRRFLHLAAGAAALPTVPRVARPLSQITSQRVRVATGFLATWQSSAWLGAEAVFPETRDRRDRRPSRSVGAGCGWGHPPRLGVAYTGTVPVAEEVSRPRHRDLAMPTSDFSDLCHDQGGISNLAQLSGRNRGPAEPGRPAWRLGSLSRRREPIRPICR
jgi:hypothetical protein